MNKTAAKRRTTIEDVAAAVGVTKSTVSLALAHKGNFTEARREEIWRVARQMNYVPNPHAQRLVTGRFEKMVALFTLSLDLNVGTRKLQHLQYLLIQAGYEVPIYANGHASQAAGQVDLMNMLCLQRPRAIVCNMAGLLPETLQLLERFQQEGGIVVSYDQAIEVKYDQVVFDREDSTRLVTKHLLELGHRKIAFAAPSTVVGNPNYQGFYRALAECRVRPNSEWFLDEEVAGPAEPFSDMYEADGVNMARRFLQLSPRPSAVVLMDDYTAVAFAAELERAGVRVPDDVSIVSHDDSPIAGYGPLPLTTVTHPVKDIAVAAVDLLKQRLQDADAPARRIVVRGELVVRKSAIPA